MKNKEETLILIVEDEDSIRLTLRDYLQKKGFKVFVASDGVGAIKQLLDNDIDIIVSDYKMDLLGGEYWIKLLKTYYNDKTIIITSGFLDPEFSIPFEVLYKPYNYSKLEEFIENAIIERKAKERHYCIYRCYLWPCSGGWFQIFCL